MFTIHILVVDSYHNFGQRLRGGDPHRPLIQAEVVIVKCGSKRIAIKTVEEAQITMTCKSEIHGPDSVAERTLCGFRGCRGATLQGRARWKSLLLLPSCLILGFLLLAPNTLVAQSSYGSISGIVADPSGAVVPGAAVIITNVATGVKDKTQTGARGTYRVSFLKPGQYVVEVAMKGFQKYKTHPIHLVLNQAAVVDATLQLGKETETITVSAAGTGLNQINPQVGAQFGSSDLINLPETITNHGANELLLAKLTPGVAATNTDYGNVNNMTYGGGAAGTAQIIVDGVPSNMGTDDTYGFVPTPNSTQELQILTAPFSAQYGQTGGGALLTTTKSGTQSFHGSLFFFHNDQSLNAVNYFTPPHTVKPVSVYNYFGGAIGGPVWIPRIFDGRKHHLFFFTDWEDTLNPRASTFNQNVPTDLERQGNFTGPTPEGTPTPTIYDPATSTVVNGVRQEDPFPGNIIPTDRLDPVALNIMKFYPEPNCSLNGFNYCVRPSALNTYLYNSDRIDYDPTSSNHFFAKFNRDGPTNGIAEYIPNAANSSALSGWKDDQYEVSWSHIFSSTLTNDARLAYVSENNFREPDTVGVSELGLKGVILSQFPNINVNNIVPLGTGGYEKERDGHLIVNDALVWLMGHHTLSIGGVWMDYHLSDYEPGVLSGSYNFTGTFSSITGQGFSGLPDLELGLPATTSINTTTTWFREVAKYGALYIEDDYRLTPKLTVNLGVRYEYDGPYAEVKNSQDFTFDPNIRDETTGLPGGILFAGYKGAPHSLQAADWMFLPRVGFSFHPLTNTVVRGGFGIFESPGIGFGEYNTTSNETVSATFQTQDGVTPVYQLMDGVPAHPPNVGPDGEPLIPSSITNPTSDIVQVMRKRIPSYFQQWQFGIQQGLGSSWVAEIDYEGSHGVHLPIDLPVNQIAPIPNCCFNRPNAQSLRPYPQWLDIDYLVNGGASQYNALLAQLTHRWKGGLSMSAAYTWAHSMNDVDLTSHSNGAGIQNAYNLASQWGTSMMDIPQRFALSGVYNVPVGSGGRVLQFTPVLNHVLGHWRVGTIAQFQIGYPRLIGQNNTLGLFSQKQYVTKVGDPTIPRGSRTIEKWFNTGAFEPTPADTLGNAPRAGVFGPGQNVWSISLMRDFPLWHESVFTIRADAFNAFNHPQFNNINTSITSGSFGKLTGAQDPRQVLVSGRIQF